MLEIIVAVNENFGIGNHGVIPWECKGDLAHFRNLTRNSNLIVGRTTCNSLPLLRDRNIICMSRNDHVSDMLWFNKVTISHKIEGSYDDGRYFVAGGSEIYKLFLDDRKPPIHMSVIKNNMPCDRFFDRSWLDGYLIKTKEEHEDFTYLYMEWSGENTEHQYLNILSRILDTGSLRNTRNGNVMSTFNGNMTFDLRDGFPLLTTKKMFIRGIIEELLFFLRGDTDTSVLSQRGVKIWEGNTTREFIDEMGLPYAENVMGPMYGYQWRKFNKPYEVGADGRPIDGEGGIDQLKDVIHLINTDPTSRRILLTTYNPSQAREGVLYPCHSIVSQFYVDGDYVDMFCYNRSQDSFLGTPYNIASSSLLLIIICKICNKIPRKFHMTMGDIHIYESHIQVVKEQIKRIPYKLPVISINGDVNDINSLEFKDFSITGYKSDAKLSAEMIV
jgi:dihydrofolate reductase / thymidylate synthase